ncbi:unnamed protein product [Ectocarpus sp. 4 AP-2014]
MMLAGSSSFKGKDDMATYDEAMEVNGFIEDIRAELTEKLSRADKRTKQELEQMLRTIKSGKGSVLLKSNDKSQDEGAMRALEKAKKVKANAKTDAEKVAATKAGETAKALWKEEQQAEQEAMHLFAKNPSAESVEGRIRNWGDKIKKLQHSAFLASPRRK